MSQPRSVSTRRLNLEANPDVARAVAAKVIGSGWLHYVHHGKNEGRPLGTPSASMAGPSTLSKQHAGTGFLAPTDLRLEAFAPKRIALIGSCFLQDWKFHVDNPSKCDCDLFLLNNAGNLPDFDPALYELQVLQISFRSLVKDAAFWRPLNDEAAYQEAFAAACQRLSFQLRPRLELASKAGLLTFVVNYLVPQRNPIGILHRRFDFRNPEHFVQRLNEFLEEHVRKFANAYVLDVDRLAASIGRRFVQDDAIAIFAHNTTWPTWGTITDRIEPVPPLSEFYDVRHLDLFRDLVWAELQTMSTSPSKPMW